MLHQWAKLIVTYILGQVAAYNFYPRTNSSMQFLSLDKLQHTIFILGHIIANNFYPRTTYLGIGQNEAEKFCPLGQKLCGIETVMTVAINV